ncbi:TonB-dependent receptor [Zhongshania sp. BJYM1]|uniref:TonB-dependent receptor n=1 Tax=Zhongshania aquatica TaxID=2965069 RepID=UPI0022B41D24|nr:TonB-dependent receptor [Marortus sp. BJYM1]
MNKNKVNLALLAICLCQPFMFGSQNAIADDEQDESLKQKKRQIEEVIVTATKRDMNLRDIAASINAITGASLESSGAQGQEDFLKVVPGVTFYNDNVNSSRITIRGIGADLNTSNTTGVFIGDVSFEDPVVPRVTLDPNPFDLARVEILKGPQGTLFGGSALNGAVRYIPQEPVLNEWEAKAYYQYESVKFGGSGSSRGAVVNIPLGDTIAVRLLGFERESAGWVDDIGRNLKDVNETEQVGARAMALWQPTEKLRISGMYIEQDTEIRDSAITDNTEGRLSRSNTPQASPQNPRYSLGTIGVQYSFDSFDVVSQTSKTEKKFNAFIDTSRIGNIPNPPPSVSTINNNRSESISQELRFASNSDSSWTWLFGGFYRELDLVDDTIILASDSISLGITPETTALLNLLYPGIVNQNGKVNVARGYADPVEFTETAFFGEITKSFWESLEITLGLRAFKNTSEAKTTFTGLLVATQLATDGRTTRVREGKLDEDGINPKVVVKYTFNDNISLYASATKGFRFGGPQVLIGTFTSESPDLYKSDTLWAYEMGLRTEWFDNTLTFDVTPFQIDWNDPQLQQSDSSGLGSFFDNVGGSQVRGVEVASTYLTPLTGLSITFAGSYVENKTTEPFKDSSGNEIAAGSQWPLAAKKQSATTIAYQHDLFSGWLGKASVTYVTISKAPNTLAYLDEVFGYETIDGQIAFSNENIVGRPEISIVVSNLTDERGIISGINNPQFASDHVYIRPRTVTARLSLSF